MNCAIKVVKILSCRLYGSSNCEVAVVDELMQCGLAAISIID